MRTLPFHLALLGLIIAVTGCPSDDAPKGPYTSADPEVADDDSTTAKPEPEDPKPNTGDGDGDSAAESCEDELARVKAELAACMAAK